jgi:hypothetical protein
MRKVGLDDLVGLSRYARLRDDFRRRIIALKRDRRITIGDRVTLVFENFDTIRFQIQEMLFVERIADIDKIREECDVYNALLPGDRELSATLFVEITEAARIEEELSRLVGIDEHVVLHIGEHAVRAHFEPGRSRADKISAVQYVRFPLDEAAARALVTPGMPVRLAIDHPGYRAETSLDEAQRASLASDIAA